MMIPPTLVRRFLADSRVSVAMIVGLSIIALAGALGVAIDSARGYTEQSKLQGAVYAAALAAAKAYLANLDETAVEDEARMFFDANYADDIMDGSVVDFDAGVNLQCENMVVQASEPVPTTFMQIFGFDQLTLCSAAEVSASHTNLELALVVDVTGSMNWTDTNGDIKIYSLKTAGLASLEAICGEATSLPGATYRSCTIAQPSISAIGQAGSTAAARAHTTLTVGVAVCSQGQRHKIKTTIRRADQAIDSRPTIGLAAWHGIGGRLSRSMSEGRIGCVLSMRSPH